MPDLFMRLVYGAVALSALAWLIVLINRVLVTEKIAAEVLYIPSYVLPVGFSVDATLPAGAAYFVAVNDWGEQWLLDHADKKTIYRVGFVRVGAGDAGAIRLTPDSPQQEPFGPHPLSWLVPWPKDVNPRRCLVLVPAVHVEEVMTALRRDGLRVMTYANKEKLE